MKTLKNRPTIIGVMGGSSGNRKTLDTAYRMGALIAEQGWVLLNGGRNVGVMHASAQGAKENGGLTIGILPDTDRRHTSDYIDIPILTGMGQARNSINVLSCDIVVACPGGPGTVSEIALALKYGKPVILLNHSKDAWLTAFEVSGKLQYASSPEDVIEKILSLV